MSNYFSLLQVQDGKNWWRICVGFSDEIGFHSDFIILFIYEIIVKADFVIALSSQRNEELNQQGLQKLFRLNFILI